MVVGGFERLFSVALLHWGCCYRLLVAPKGRRAAGFPSASFGFPCLHGRCILLFSWEQPWSGGKSVCLCSSLDPQCFACTDHVSLHGLIILFSDSQNVRFGPHDYLGSIPSNLIWPKRISCGPICAFLPLLICYVPAFQKTVLIRPAPHRFIVSLL